MARRITRARLTPVDKVVKGNVTPSKPDDPRIAGFRNARDAANEQLTAARLGPLLSLKSAVPGQEGMTIAQASVMGRLSVSGVQRNKYTGDPESEIYFSERRLKTEEGLADLEQWQPLQGMGAGGSDRVAAGQRGAGQLNAVRNVGSRLGRDVSRLAQELRNADPELAGAGSRAGVDLYRWAGQLDSQAWFVLASTGFMDRLRASVTKGEKRAVDTERLIETFHDMDKGPGSEWESIIEEVKNARQYNVNSRTKQYASAGILF